MRVDLRRGSYAEIRALQPDHAEILDAIRATVHTADPDGIEVASPGERSVWWGVGSGKMKDGYAYAMPHTAHVNLGFFQGAALPDPGRCLEGTGKMLRHVKIKTVARVAEADIRALLDAAIAERQDARKDNR